MADEDVSIVVGAQDRASPVLRHIERAVDDVGDKSAGAVPKVEKFGDAVDDAGDASARAVPKHLADAKAIHEVGDQASKAARKVNRLSASARLGAGRRGFLGMIGVTGRLGRIFKLFLIPLILDAVGALATLGSAAGAAGMAGIGALSPVVGVVGALPGAIAAAVASFATFKIGFSGIGDALGALGDPEKFAEAMKALSPPARAFVNVIKGFQKPWDNLKEAVQRSVLPPMTDAVKGLGKVYLPILRRGLTDTGRALGQMVTRTAGFLTSGRAQAQVGGVMRANAQVIRTLSGAGASAMRVLLNVMTAAAPMVQRMAEDFAAFLDRIAAASDNRSGLAGFFQTAYDVLKKVITFTTDLTMALVNVGRIGADLGSEMGASFLGMADRFRDFTESASGAEKIKGWFDAMKPVIWEVGYLIRDLGKGLASISMDDSLVGSLQSIRTQLLPALLDLIKAASGKFIPALSRIVGDVAKILIETQAFPAILAVVQGSLSAIATIISALPGPVKQLLGYMVTLKSLFTLSGLLGFFGRLGGGGGARGGMFAGMFTGLSAGFKNVGFAIKSVMGGAATAREAFSYLGTAAGGAAMAAKLLRFGYAAAFAAIVIGAMEARRRVDELTTATSDATAAFTQAATAENMDALKAQIDKVAAMRDEYASHNWFTALFQGETWSDVGTFIGNAFNGSKEQDAPYIIDQISQAGANAQDALLDYQQAIGAAARETGVAGERAYEAANAMGLTLTGGVGAASSALTKYLYVNEVAKPAVRDLYNGIVASGNAALTAADRVDGFSLALTSLANLTGKGGGATQAAVASAKAIDQIGQAAKGAEVSMKGGEVRFKATAKANWALNDALAQSAEAARLAAVETYRETGSREKALATYKRQYNFLVNNLTTALGGNRKMAKALAQEYLNTPGQVTTVFNDPGLRQMVERGADAKEISRYLNGLKVTTTFESKIPNTTGLPWYIAGRKRPSKQEGYVPITPQVDTTQIDSAADKARILNERMDTAVGPRTIGVTSPGLSSANTQANGLLNSLNTMSAPCSQWQIDVVLNVIEDNVKRALGGPVLAGTRYTVGELGPELFVPTGGGQTQVIGATGQEQRTFPTSGYVIPNDALTRAWESGASALASRGSRRDRGSTTAEPLPAVTVGPVYVQEPIDLQRAVTKGVAEARRNWEERH